jgi:hypothetical protein
MAFKGSLFSIGGDFVVGGINSISVGRNISFTIGHDYIEKAFLL